MRGHSGISFWAILAVLGVLSLPPLVMIVTMSFQTGLLTRNVSWSLVNYAFAAARLSWKGPLLNSLIFALGATLISLLLGGVLAFLTERTNAPFRRLAYLSALALVAIPAPVYAFAWVLLFGKQGPFNFYLPIQIDINNLPGMIVVEGFGFSALGFLLLAGPMRSVDRALEEAALMNGAGAWRMFLDITAPMILPALLGVFILNTIRGMEAFAVPAMIGARGQVSVLTTEIYYAVTQQQPPQYGIAAAYGIILVVFVVALLLVYSSLTSRASRFATITGKAYRLARTELRAWRKPAAFFILLYFAIAMMLPLGILILASFQSYYGGMRFSAWTFVHYRELLQTDQVATAFLNSLLVAASAAAAVMLITGAAAWHSVRGKARGRHALDLLASLPLALPGTVLGVALLFLFIRLPLPIYGSLLALIIAAVIRVLPYGFRYAHAALVQVHPELEEAALMNGATRAQVSRQIVLPLISMPILAGLLYVFLASARELEAASLLVTGQTQVVAPLLIELYQNGTTSLLAAFSIVLTMLYGVIALGLYSVGRGWGASI